MSEPRDAMRETPALPSLGGSAPTDRYVRFGGMTWPRHTTDIGWTLRYGTPSETDLLFAASIIDAYQTLVEATAKKRAVVVRELRATLPSEGARP